MIREGDKGWMEHAIVWVDPAEPTKLWARVIYLAKTGETKTDDDDRADLLEALGLGVPKKSE